MSHEIKVITEQKKNKHYKWNLAKASRKGPKMKEETQQGAHTPKKFHNITSM